MDTLTDVNTHGGGKPSHTGFVPSVSPEAISSQTGVSVRYAQHPDKKWFVIKVSYGREKQAYDFITNAGTEAFFPLGYALKLVNGKKRRCFKPLVPNILFVYSTQEEVETFVNHTPELDYVSYYYDHFRTDENGKNPPLTVRYKDMINFIRVIETGSEHVKMVDKQQCRYKSGDLVIVIDGTFKGVTGKVARVSGQQRVIVELKNLCLIATAYIPTNFIKKL